MPTVVVAFGDQTKLLVALRAPALVMKVPAARIGYAESPLSVVTTEEPVVTPDIADLSWK